MKTKIWWQYAATNACDFSGLVAFIFMNEYTMTVRFPKIATNATIHTIILRIVESIISVWELKTCTLFTFRGHSSDPSSQSYIPSATLNRGTKTAPVLGRFGSMKGALSLVSQ